MYTNVVQHCNCQFQDNFSTLNITLRFMIWNLDAIFNVYHDYDDNHGKQKILLLNNSTKFACNDTNSFINARLVTVT